MKRRGWLYKILGFSSVGMFLGTGVYSGDPNLYSITGFLSTVTQKYGEVAKTILGVPSSQVTAAGLILFLAVLFLFYSILYMIFGIGLARAIGENVREGEEVVILRTIKVVSGVFAFITALYAPFIAAFTAIALYAGTLIVAGIVYILVHFAISLFYKDAEENEGKVKAISLGIALLISFAIVSSIQHPSSAAGYINSIFGNMLIVVAAVFIIWLWTKLGSVLETSKHDEPSLRDFKSLGDRVIYHSSKKSEKQSEEKKIEEESKEAAEEVKAEELEAERIQKDVEGLISLIESEIKYIQGLERSAEPEAKLKVTAKLLESIKRDVSELKPILKRKRQIYNKVRKKIFEIIEKAKNTIEGNEKIDNISKKVFSEEEEIKELEKLNEQEESLIVDLQRHISNILTVTKDLEEKIHFKGKETDIKDLQGKLKKWNDFLKKVVETHRKVPQKLRDLNQLIHHNIKFVKGYRTFGHNKAANETLKSFIKELVQNLEETMKLLERIERYETYLLYIESEEIETVKFFVKEIGANYLNLKRKLNELKKTIEKIKKSVENAEGTINRDIEEEQKAEEETKKLEEVAKETGDTTMVQTFTAEEKIEKEEEKILKDINYYLQDLNKQLGELKNKLQTRSSEVLTIQRIFRLILRDAIAIMQYVGMLELKDEQLTTIITNLEKEGILKKEKREEIEKIIKELNKEKKGVKELKKFTQELFKDYNRLSTCINKKESRTNLLNALHDLLKAIKEKVDEVKDILDTHGELFKNIEKLKKEKKKLSMK